MSFACIVLTMRSLHRELVQHGAGFLQYLDSKTMATHIIASTLPPKKAVEFKNYRIVNPAWVTESIKAGKLLPWSDYRVFEEGAGQKTLMFDGGKLSSQATHKAHSGYREHTQNSFYTTQLQKSSGRLSATNTSSPLRPNPSTDSLALAGHNTESTDRMRIDPPLTFGEASPKETLYDESVFRHPSVIGQNDEDSGNSFTPAMALGPGEQPNPDTNPEQESPSKQRELTSEEHNALLLADPRIRKSSTANPNFLKQFYSESRLHHLSTWKAELKSKLQKMAAENGSVAKIAKRRPGGRRYIMHVDFDSFFCAVSLKKSPEYISKPAVVAHGTGSGSEIASCNYPAREFGVKNGMWMKRAMELCPDLKVLPYDFPAYEEASQLFYSTIFEVGGVVQSVSIDEALVDITAIVLGAAASEGTGVDEGSVWKEQEEADKIATAVRRQVLAKTGCNVSIGIAGNILLAKVALRKAKPAGQHQIRPEDVMDGLADLKVEALPGVAHSIAGKLEEISVKFVKDIRQTSKERLISVLGPKTGERLWDYSRGIDRSEVGDQPVRKSVSAEVNWGIRFVNQEQAEDFLHDLSKELERRLLNEGVRGKQFTLKIMRRSMDAPLDPPKHLGHGKCDTFNKSTVFGVATNNADVIAKDAVAILRSYKFSPGDLRGLGLSLTKLEPLKANAAAPEGSQKKLHFGAPTSFSMEKRAKLEAIDDERDREETRQRGQDIDDDPITDDPLTPRKPKMHPAIAFARARNADAKAQTPLNIGGTQFVLPPNADSSILAELPDDILSRLMAQGAKSNSASRDASPSLGPRVDSPALTDEIPSDVDPEVFEALPEYMKAEILHSYGQARGRDATGKSSRPDKAASKPKKPTTPTKRGGGKGTVSRARERRADAQAGLFQTNFAAGFEEDAVSSQDLDAPDELDPAILAELPEDVRNEIIADHRQRRLAQRPPGLALHGRKQRLAATLPAGQTRIYFPPRPPKVSFSGSALSSAQDVKGMLATWYDETRDDGPHRGDVEVFEKFLTKVVVEEKDMEKARMLVLWLGWKLEGNAGKDKGQRKWKSAMAAIQDAVQKATFSRGLGPMDFGS